MTRSTAAILRDMASFRQRRLSEGYYTDTAITFVKQEIGALEAAIEVLSGQKVVPEIESLMWDHHEAMHTDCSYDWTGLYSEIAPPKHIIAEPPPADSWSVRPTAGGQFEKVEGA